MESYLPIYEAANITRRTVFDLKELAENGKIKSVMLNNDILLRVSDVMAMQPTEDYSDLEGQPIGIGEAARKYHIHQQTISRWKDKGLVRVISQVGQKIMINEADIARMAKYYLSRPGRGRRTDIDLQK